MILDKLLGAPELLHPGRQPQTEVMQDLSHPLSRDLISRHLLNEGSGLFCQDLIGGLTGTLTQDTGTLRVIDPLKGKVTLFDGDATSHVNCGASTAHNVQNNTLSLWFYAVFSGQRILASVSDSIVSTGVEWSRRATGAMGFAYNDGSVRGWYDSNSGIATLNVWHHVAFAWDQVGGNVHIYLDGVLDKTVATTTGTILYSGDSYLIGRQSSNIDWAGRLLDVRLYRRVLSANEIWQIYTDPYQDLIPVSRNLWIPSVVAAGGAVDPIAQRYYYRTHTIGQH